MANLRELAKKNPFPGPTQPKPNRELAAASGKNWLEHNELALATSY